MSEALFALQTAYWAKSYDFELFKDRQLSDHVKKNMILVQ